MARTRVLDSGAEPVRHAMQRRRFGPSNLKLLHVQVLESVNHHDPNQCNLLCLLVEACDPRATALESL